ncbi:MAG: SIS domain-containing protein [Candidatus Midichloriaceae bacterium]
MQKECDLILIGKQIIEDEINGLKDLEKSIDSNFYKIIKKIIDNSGRLILSGMGKSGYVARKISSTLSSTGTPSFFIHPAEAGHGDLGMITKNDIVVLLSNSGDTYELNTIIDYCKRFNIYIIGITRKNNSILSKISDLPIILPNSKEASDIDVPSTSVIMMIAYWDAIAIALQKIRNFSQEDFKNLHPGGKIGAKLLKVSKLMHKKESIPTVSINSSGMDVILEMTKKGFGCTAVLNDEGELIGIVTDGDLRRHIDMDLKNAKAKDIMSKKPFSVEKDFFASQALFIMNENNITQIFVVKDHKPIGVIHMHDLVRAGIV